jgi:hypothetical protein
MYKVNPGAIYLGYELHKLLLEPVSSTVLWFYSETSQFNSKHKGEGKVKAIPGQTLRVPGC